MMLCKFCNTENTDSQRRCVSCGALLKDRKTKLTGKDFDLLRKFAEISEKSVSAETGVYDIKFALTVLGFTVLQAFIIYSTYSSFKYKILSILLSLFSAAVIIVAGSYAIVRQKDNSVKKTFENETKYRIREYLKEMQFSENHFRDILKKNPEKYPYLHNIYLKSEK